MNKKPLTQEEIEKTFENHQQEIIALRTAMLDICDRMDSMEARIEATFLLAQAAASRIPPNA